METTNIETLLIASASFAALIVASLFLTGYLVIPAMEWFIIPQDCLENVDNKMKKINIYKKILVLAIAMALIVSGPAIAKTDVKTFKGTIEGALCVLDGKKCPPDDFDAHLLIENNFVLLTSGGQYYYLPNLNRTLKARYAGKDVQITGTAKGESIIVDKLEAKEGGKYKLVWSREKQKRELINYLENITMG